VIVEVVGEVDHYTAPLLGGCLRRQCERRGLRELVVDMDGVTFLAGAGLTVLAQARQRCSTRGVRLMVRCSGRRAVLRPLQLAGLSGLVPLDPGEHRSSSSRGGAAMVEPAPRNTEQPWRRQ
jgi:anti-sigma B factor antagonist